MTLSPEKIAPLHYIVLLSSDQITLIIIIIPVSIMLSLRLGITVLFLISQITTLESFAPKQAFTIKLDKQILMGMDLSGFLKIQHQMVTPWQKIVNASIIGSITQINTLSDPGLQFYFTSELDKNEQKAMITIFVNPRQPLSNSILITIDFMIAIFPKSHTIYMRNMTQYQSHIIMQSDKDHQLVPILNGFSNLSLSGNVTHTYELNGQMYTLRYMSQYGTVTYENNWKIGQDFLLFTCVIMPKEHLILKFRLISSTYQLAIPQNYNYFYGVKGIASEIYASNFQSSVSSIKYNVINNPDNKTYGLVFLPYSTEDLDFNDFRKHSSSKLIFLYAGIGILGVIAIVIGVILFWIKVIRKKDVETQGLNQRSSCEQSDFQSETYMGKVRKNKHIVVTQDSDNRGPQQDPGIRISTVPQVDAEYEESLRGTVKSKIDKNFDYIKDTIGNDDNFDV